MTRRLFPVRILTENPDVIRPHQRLGGTTAYDVTRKPGTHYRLSPQTADEIFALQMLEHGVEKYAPAHGDGVIVTSSALSKFL